MVRGWAGNLATRKPLCAAALLCGTVGGVGCASLDFRPDVQRAERTVEKRTGMTPDWLARPPSTEAIPSPLTARDAAAIALRNDRRIRAALERIAEARADLVQSGLLPNPVLALDLGFPIDGSGGGTKIGVSLTQQLAALITRDDRMDAARSHLDEQVLAAGDQALAVISHAKAAHARVWYAQGTLAPLTEGVGAAERAVDAAVKRVQAGEDTSLEVNRRKLALLRLRADLSRRQTELDLRKRDLLLRMGVGSASPGFEVAPDADSPADPLEKLTEDQAIALVAGRLDVAAAAASAAAAIARANAESGGRIDLAAGPAFERTDDGRKELGPALEVSIPIFDTGDARVARAVAEARRAAIEAEGVRQRAVGEARAAYISAVAARDLARRFETEIVLLASQNADLAQRGFGAGQADLTVLLEAQRSVVDARVGLIDQQERAALALIELERAVGGRLTDR